MDTCAARAQHFRNRLDRSRSCLGRPISGRGCSALRARQQGTRIGARSYAQVVSTNPAENLVTVRKGDGQQGTYTPSRLRGVSAYREIQREFVIGDRVQLTALNREMGVANRDLGTLQQIGEDGRLTVRMYGDKEKTITFDPREMSHFDPDVKTDAVSRTWIGPLSRPLPTIRLYRIKGEVPTISFKEIETNRTIRPDFWGRGKLTDAR